MYIWLVTITRLVIGKEQSVFCRENQDDQHPLSGSCPYERAEVSRPTAPHPPASQGPARRSLSSPPQRPLFIPAKTKPKVYSSHPKHPKHPDIHQRYHFRLFFVSLCFGLPAALYPPFLRCPRFVGFSVVQCGTRTISWQRLNIFGLFCYEVGLELAILNILN